MPSVKLPSIALAACLLVACSEEKQDAPIPDAGEPDPIVEDDAGKPGPVDAPDAAVPDFELRLDAHKLPVLQGASASVELTVIRRNGFAEPIVISAQALPAGVHCEPLTVSDEQEQVTLTLEADATAPHSLPTEVTVKGTAGDLYDVEQATVTVYGPPGSLDTSFQGGKVVVPAGASDDDAQALAVQADGKLVLVGGVSENLGDIALLRLARDGTLDTTFGQGGVVTTSIGAGADIGRAVAIQADGKILVAGSSVGASTGLDFVLVRYLADGSLDESFGEGGFVTTAFTDDSDTAYALALQKDGKIVVGGETNQGSSATGVDFALARYLEDGSLDPSFGTDGKVTTAIESSSARDSIYALALQEVAGEERIVAAGGEGDFALARYTPKGELDASFGTGGKLSGLFGSSIGAARAVQLDAQGKIVVAGHDTNDFALLRLTASGALDASFGTQGKVVTALSESNWDVAQALAIQADGKILAGGWVYEGNSSAGNFALVRYTEAGALDTSFDTDGIVITEVAGPMKRDEARALVLQSDERVPTVRALLGGYASGSNYDFAITRYWL